MDRREWRSSMWIVSRAQVSIGKFYTEVIDLEQKRLVESRWDEGPSSPARQDLRRRLYRRLV
jgi:hypothetical protein